MYLWEPESLETKTIHHGPSHLDNQGAPVLLNLPAFHKAVERGISEE